MKIRYYTRSKFGNDLRFPIDFVEQLEKLTGRKTLSNSDIIALKALAFELEEVLESSIKMGEA